MRNPLKRYVTWLHTQWPAGTVEKLPEVREDGTTAVPGLYVVGDLTGVPLLKFSADSGAKAVQRIVGDAGFAKRRQTEGVLDLVIVGAGVSGMAAALEARKQGLTFAIIEAAQPFNTIVNFPRGKPIFTYPTNMTPAGDLQFSPDADVRESLLESMRAATLAQGIEPMVGRVDHVKKRGDALDVKIPDGEDLRAHRVIIGIGRAGNRRRLNVPGEDLDKVTNRLHDPKDYRKKHVLIVGGGDSALEGAIALAQAGAFVTLSYRKPEFSRPKPENVDGLQRLSEDPFADVTVENPSSARVSTATGGFMSKHRRPGSIRLMMASAVNEITDDEVVIRDAAGEDERIVNDVVFTMIGREAPLDFFRRSGVPIRGEWRRMTYATCAMFVLFCIWMYHWKSGYIPAWGVDPPRLWNWIATWTESTRAWADDPGSLFYTLKSSASGRSFYYTLAYSLAVTVFGIRRIRRRRTPYVTRQTLVLASFQWLPLFLLPEIILPWLGRNGAFDGGALGFVADQLFPAYNAANLGEREYWRAYGLILAWPLSVYNWFTDAPLWGWLIVGFVQTFVIIPIIVWRWGKGAFCGWVCPCGALAETVGDAHRQKMPHGPFWNRLNLIGQVFLAFALILMALRIGGWIWPGSAIDRAFTAGFAGTFKIGSIPVVSYKWFVDLLWAGILGVCFYFWFSGRVWCRFACPLAALMHIYARFSQFRIVPEKKKCISCNVCTSVCHQGIDVMNFANKGLPMEDPECVRCSACVQSCPTGVLQFGRVSRSGEVIALDRVMASAVVAAEITVDGRVIEPT